MIFFVMSYDVFFYVLFYFFYFHVCFFSFVHKFFIKYIHVGSCFEEFIARNTMMQSDFNLDTWFTSYDFFYFKKYYTTFSLFPCMQCGLGISWPIKVTLQQPLITSETLENIHLQHMR